MHHFRKNQGSMTMGGVTLAVALIFSIGLLSACAGGGDYGRLIGAKDAYNPMREGPLGGPDYLYYKTPDEAQPNAVIAIHKGYTLDAGDDWTPIDVSGEQPQAWGVYTGGMGSVPLLIEIQGPKGQHIGLWYSVWASTVVKMVGENKVQVYPPDDFTGPVRRDEN